MPSPRLKFRVRSLMIVVALAGLAFGLPIQVAAWQKRRADCLDLAAWHEEQGHSASWSAEFYSTRAAGCLDAPDESRFREALTMARFHIGQAEWHGR